MSDLGKETPNPSSKKTQRYKQQQVVEPQRRTLLKALGLGGGAIAIGGTGLLWKIFSSPKTEVPKAANLPTARISANESAASEEEKSLVYKLKQLDLEISNNPDKFKELAPQIADMAAEYFCKQMGYDQARFKGKLHFLTGIEFHERMNNNPDCIDMNPNENTLASQFIESQDVNFNLTRILSQSVPKNGLPVAASGFFSVVIHELHHNSAPIVGLKTGSQEYKLKGALFLQPNRAGFSCPEGVRMELEEAIVQDSTDRMLQRLGMSMNSSQQYKEWVARYRDQIVNRLFGGDHKQLLKLHQETKQDEFFSLIGQRLGKSPVDAKQAGEEYTRIVFLGR